GGMLALRQVFDAVQKRGELGEHHGRGTPDARTGDVEVRNDLDDVRRHRPQAPFRSDDAALDEPRDRKLDEPFYFGSGDADRRKLLGDSNDGVQQMAAHGNRDRGEPADDLHRLRCDADLLLRFTQGSLFDGLIWMIKASTRQRHLTGVMPEAGSANGEWHVPLAGIRINQ